MVRILDGKLQTTRYCEGKTRKDETPRHLCRARRKSTTSELTERENDILKSDDENEVKDVVGTGHEVRCEVETEVRPRTDMRVQLRALVSPRARELVRQGPEEGENCKYPNDIPSGWLSKGVLTVGAIQLSWSDPEKLNCKHTYIHIYIHTYIGTYIHT